MHGTVCRYIASLFTLLSILGCETTPVTPSASVAEKGASPEASPVIPAIVDESAATPHSIEFRDWADWPLVASPDPLQPMQSVFAHLEQDIVLPPGTYSAEGILDELSQRVGVPIEADWAVLGDVDVTPDTPIRVYQGAFTLNTQLESVTRQMWGAAGDLDPIGFAPNKELIRVSTKRVLMRDRYIRVYAVSPLLSASPFSDGRFFDPQVAQASRDLAEALGKAWTALPGTEIEFPGEGGCWFGPDETQFSLVSHEEQMAILTECLTTMVGNPDEWLDMDSTIYPLGKHLVVKTSVKNHREIESILRSILNQPVRHRATYNQLVDLAVAVELIRAEELRRDFVYDEAMVHVELALEIDPEHPMALAYKELLEQMMRRN